MFWPMLILYGGGALITLLFLRYVALAGFFAEMRAMRRRARKPRCRVSPTVTGMPREAHALKRGR